MAAIDYFLKLDGISGESRDSKHKGEIEVLSFSFGETQQRQRRSGRRRRRRQGADERLLLHGADSKASPQLFLHCAQGKHIKQALLTVRKAGGSRSRSI